MLRPPTMGGDERRVDYAAPSRGPPAPSALYVRRSTSALPPPQRFDWSLTLKGQSGAAGEPTLPTATWRRQAIRSIRPR
ncbi:MAG TPA: hypothetical protein VJ777_01775, partial [Mycobacterium sp.]|nr:hypothetical protein [Mycobacterium sp.]